MERLYRKQKAHGFVLAAVSLDADPGVVPAFVKKQGLTFPILLDPKSQVANTYGVRALPSTFIVDRQGTMAALALGPRPWDGPVALALVAGMLR